MATEEIIINIIKTYKERYHYFKESKDDARRFKDNKTDDKRIDDVLREYYNHLLTMTDEDIEEEAMFYALERQYSKLLHKLHGKEGKWRKE